MGFASGNDTCTVNLTFPYPLTRLDFYHAPSFIKTFILPRFCHGSNGRTPNQRAHERAGVVVRDVRRVHHGPRRGPHLRAYDLHVFTAQYRRCQQDGDAWRASQSVERLASREDEGIHRAGVGVQHSSR